MHNKPFDLRLMTSISLLFFFHSLWSFHGIVLERKGNLMAMQNGSNSSGVLWERAKELLKREDYERLKIALKSFSTTRSVEGLCSDLLKIVNSRSKVDILTEVRQCLPRNQRNKFTRHCNELLEIEAAHERGDFEKKRKKIERKESERENNAPNFQGSPAKKTRKDREKSPSSRTDKRVSGRLEGQANQARKIDRANIVNSDTLNSHGEVHRIIVIERKSLNQSFGFRIRGGTFHQPSITIAQVAKDSIAHRQGLKIGDRILRVNEQRCGRGGLEMAEVIGIIKVAKSIRMRIVSEEVFSKNECKAQAKGEKPAGEEEEKTLSTISVYPDEDGWLGCCIRGGKDYSCAVHIISVSNGSPAERAGVKAGDVIVEVNGTSIKDLTHVQVVRLVITSGHCVTFSLKPGRKQGRHLSRPNPVEMRPTPLRTQYRGSCNVTPPGSPTYRQFHLPGYPHKKQGAAVDSPSQLPMDVMRLDCMPPPPYTPEVPSRHRLLAKGGEGQEPLGSPHQQKPQETYHHQESQGSSCQDNAQTTPNQKESQDTHYEQEPQDAYCQQQPQGTQQQEPHELAYQREPQANPFQQGPQDTYCKEVAMEIIDYRQPDFDENLRNVSHDGSIMENNFAPHTIINAIPQEEETSLAEKEALINETNNESPTELSGSGTSQSPIPGNGRESLLSQIRQFNKTKLKKLVLYPESNSSDQLQSISSGRIHAPDELQETEGGKEGPQDSVNPAYLLSALNQVLQNRARALHDTLSSADEFDSSDDDDDYDEWEL